MTQKEEMLAVTVEDRELVYSLLSPLARNEVEKMALTYIRAGQGDDAAAVQEVAAFRTQAVQSSAGEVERLREAWQAVSTMPDEMKDGRGVLLAEQWSADIVASMYRGSWVGDLADGYWLSHCGQYVTEAPDPTHWMPCPPNPLTPDNRPSEGEG